MALKNFQCLVEIAVGMYVSGNQFIKSYNVATKLRVLYSVKRIAIASIRFEDVGTIRVPPPYIGVP